MTYNLHFNVTFISRLYRNTLIQCFLSTIAKTHPRFAAAYIEAILNHPWMREWIDAAQEEPWVIESFEAPAEADA